MDKLKAIKVKQASGQYGEAIPIGVDATNVDLINGKDLETSVVYLDEESQETDVDFTAVELQRSDIVDNLSSTNGTTKVLSANQGRVLNNMVNNLDAQFQTAVSAVTVDSEVQNIRVKADGTTAISAGNAVREQITQLNSEIDTKVNDLKEDIDNLNNFIKIIENITWVKNGYIDYRNGILQPFSLIDNRLFYTDFIKINVDGEISVLSSKTTATDDYSGIAFYDINKNFISGSNYNQESDKLLLTKITVPENAYYFRFSCLYEEYTSKATIYISTINSFINSFTHKKDFNDIKDSVKITGIQYTDNAYINYTDGIKKTLSGVLSASDYIPISNNVNIILKGHNTPTTIKDGRGIAFYDIRKSFISGIQYDGSKDLKCTTPNNTRYMRFTAISSVKNTLELYISNSINEVLPLNNFIIGDSLPSSPLETFVSSPGLISIFRNVGCIGDSLASGFCVGKDSNGNDVGYGMLEFSWGQYLSRMTGNKYYNWSTGGLRTDSFLSSQFATECYDGNHKCELYIIGLGQNDHNKGTTVGISTDIDLNNYDNNNETFYGYYGKIIQKIKEVQPKAKIFACTDPLITMETRGYNNAIREMGNIFDNVYIMDLYTYAKHIYSSSWLNNMYRGGHLNAMGYYICALIIANYIDWYMKYYWEEFREVEFINFSDRHYYD